MYFNAWLEVCLGVGAASSAAAGGEQCNGEHQLSVSSAAFQRMVMSCHVMFTNEHNTYNVHDCFSGQDTLCVHPANEDPQFFQLLESDNGADKFSSPCIVPAESSRC